MGVTVCLRLLPGCNLNPGPSATESSTLTTRLPSMICVLIISMPAQQQLTGRSTVSRAFLSRRNKYRGTLTTVGPARVCVSVLIRAIWVRISEHTRTENGRAIQRCSPKKEVGGRLKQDLDRDFLNNLGLHSCCTEIILHCVSVSNQLQQWTNFCTSFSPKSEGSGGRVPCRKKWGTPSPASPPHYTVGAITHFAAARRSIKGGCLCTGYTGWVKK